MKFKALRDFVTGNSEVTKGTVLDTKDPACPVPAKLLLKIGENLCSIGHLEKVEDEAPASV